MQPYVQDTLCNRTSRRFEARYAQNIGNEDQELYDERSPVQSEAILQSIILA